MRWKQGLFEIAPNYWAGNILMDEVVAKARNKFEILKLCKMSKIFILI